MCDDGNMSWHLSIDKKTAFHVGYGASSVFRKLNAFDMYWHAEGMKTIFEGWVTYNGERYLVRPEDCYGYADKNWGRDFTVHGYGCHILQLPFQSSLQVSSHLIEFIQSAISCRTSGAQVSLIS